MGIHLSPKVLDYFKERAAETGLPYQKLIDRDLLECAKRRRKLVGESFPDQEPDHG